ncbi:MAG: hypothetical protein U0572_08455 [Phycisphaerales bacterium]
MPRIHLTGPVAAALFASASVVATPPAYTVTEIPTLGLANNGFEPGSVANCVTAGATVGYSITFVDDRNIHAFRLTNGELTDLGVLPGDEHSMAFGANAAGDAVGVSYVLGNLTAHGVRWNTTGAPVLLGSIEPRDINSAGAIAGSTPVAGALGTSHATLLVGTSSTDLGTLGGPSSMGFALNEQNWVVGESLLSDNRTTRAFVWRNGAMLNLGTLGGATSRALDIDGLRVVGIADTTTQPHATMWTLNADGSLASKTDLGTLPGATASAAYSVNASGVVVGTSNDRATRWTGGAIVDLNTLIDAESGWTLTRANSIDAAGRIAGVGKHGGVWRAFVLTPHNAADLNNDGVVDSLDLAILLGAWGRSGSPADLDGDGTVGSRDLGILLGSWS